MTPAGTMTQPEGWVVITFTVQGGDWNTTRREFKSESIARAVADDMRMHMHYGASQLHAVFLCLSGSNTWETVGTKYDVPRQVAA